jgi:hypothetical protein
VSRRSSTPAALVVCAIFFVAVFFGLSIWSFPPAHGERSGDVRAVVAAAMFARSGLERTAWLEVEDARHELGMPPLFYFRHPAGGAILLGAALKAGLPPWVPRLLALGGSASALFAWFLLVRRATGDAALALSALAALGAYPPYHLMADSLQWYAQTFLAKGWALLLLGTAAMDPDRRRWGAVAGAGAFAFLGVSVLGLETMPAIGLFSALAPLLLSRARLRERVLRAAGYSAIVATGMALGFAARIPSLLVAVGGSLERLLHAYAWSLSSRSAGTFVPTAHDRGYVADLLWRLVDYAPLHAGLIALGIVLAAVRPGSHAPSSPAARLLVTLLLVELPHFVVMRQHAYQHSHTAAHAAFSVGLSVALAIEAVARPASGRVRPRLRTALVVLLASITPWVAPIEAYSDLSGPMSRRHHAWLRAQQAEVLAVLPPDAVVALPSDVEQDWNLSAALALDGRTFVAGGKGHRPPARALVGELPRVTGRPVFAILGTQRDPELVRELSLRHPVVARNRLYVALAVGNTEGLDLPRLGRALDPSHVAAASLVAPPDAAAAKLRYRLFGRSGSTFWLHAPDPGTGSTVVLVPLPPELAPIVRLACRLDYPANGRTKQPAVVVDLEILGRERERLGDPALAQIRLDPGSLGVVLAARIAADAHPVALRLGIAVAPGSRSNNAAVVTCREVEIEP